MMNVSVQVDDKEVRADLRKAPQLVVSGLGGWVRSTTGMAGDAAKDEAPQVTSQLQTSIRAKYSGNFRAEVKPNAEYAKYVIGGTGLYGPKKRPITPRSASVLAFSVSGSPVFARSVKGQKPNDFMERAYKSVKPRADRAGEKVLNDIINGV